VTSIRSQVTKPLQPSGCNFFLSGTLTSAMQGWMHGAKRSQGRERLAMHWPHCPTAPQAVQESGSLEQNSSPQSSSGRSVLLVTTVCQRVPEPPGKPRVKGCRAGPYRMDVQSDDSRQPPPSRTLCVGRTFRCTKPCDAVLEGMLRLLHRRYIAASRSPGVKRSSGPCERFQSPTEKTSCATRCAREPDHAAAPVTILR
jgi:hypothetical protein